MPDDAGAPPRDDAARARCPSCHIDNPAGARFCRRCGNTMAVAAPTPRGRRRWVGGLIGAVVLAAVAGGATMAFARSGDAAPSLSAAGFVPDPRLATDGTLEVDVRAADHEVARDDNELRLYVDDVLVDAQTGGGPWTLRWNEPDPGVHRVHVTVWSDGRLTTSDRVTFTAPEPLADRDEPAVEDEHPTPPRPDPSRTTTTRPTPGHESFGQWIVVVASLPTDEYAEWELHGEMEARGLPWLRYLRSDDYPSLRPGYWVLYDGPLASSASAVDQCAAWGLSTPSECYGRPLTDDPADRDVVAE